MVEGITVKTVTGLVFDMIRYLVVLSAQQLVRVGPHLSLPEWLCTWSRRSRKATWASGWKLRGTAAGLRGIWRSLHTSVRETIDDLVLSKFRYQ